LTHWLPLVTTAAGPEGLAYFVDKSTMHLDRQSAAADPICGQIPVGGNAAASGTVRFYRAVARGPE
jgi:hypothetical protein